MNDHQPEPLTLDTSSVALWVERGECQINLWDTRSDKIVLSWKTETVGAMIEDGYLKIGRLRDGDPKCHQTMLAYYLEHYR